MNRTSVNTEGTNYEKKYVITRCLVRSILPCAIGGLVLKPCNFPFATRVWCFGRCSKMPYFVCRLHAVPVEPTLHVTPSTVGSRLQMSLEVNRFSERTRFGWSRILSSAMSSKSARYVRVIYRVSVCSTRYLVAAESFQLHAQTVSARSWEHAEKITSVFHGSDYLEVLVQPINSCCLSSCCFFKFVAQLK